MKTVLLATDFSTSAYCAAIFAGEIAHLLGARLVVFFALSPLAKMQDEASPVLDLEIIMQRKLDALAHEMRNRFGISVSRLLKPGFPEDEIPALAARLNASVVIAGANNDGVNSNPGNVARELLMNNNFPVVCVPAVGKQEFSTELSCTAQHEKALSNKPGKQFLEKLMVRAASELKPGNRNL